MTTRAIRTEISWPIRTSGEKTPSAAKNWTPTAPLHQASLVGSRLLLAVLPALAILVGAAWAVSAFTIPNILQALIWAAGFIFLALAVDSKRSNFGALVATGLALPILAVLSAEITTEFAVVAAALIAAWVAAAILKY